MVQFNNILKFFKDIFLQYKILQQKNVGRESSKKLPPMHNISVEFYCFIA